jgi:diaminohydroxyphosphoribosylaminopyrimidine deaminase/5-amino-6-(5-phosphoribosylamino)uracil reductase
MDDRKYMKMALELAQKRLGFTSPNPCVGAVVVKSGKVISNAFHEKAGFPHAEVKALKLAGKKAKGASLYVTLEPCVHFGKTPPCCDSIVKSGVKKVIIATKDPNPLNNGRGIRRLKEAGIEVVTGILKEEATYLNRCFFKFITEGLPFIFIKVAQSLDGKIATRTGEAKWITSKESRAYVQKLRYRTDAILVGINTIIKDNPRLTCRLTPKKLLTKIIIDPHLKMPLKAKIFKEAKKVIIVTKKGKLTPKRKILNKKAVIVEVKCNKEGRLNLRQALQKIAKLDVVSIMVEGGGETITNFIREKLFDEIFIFIAPKIIGGEEAPTSVEGKGVSKIKNALYFKDFALERVGNDLLLKLKNKNVYWVNRKSC